MSKAASTVTAGSSVYIAGGTYREAAGVTCANAGADGSWIYYIGDPDQVNFPDLDPAPVRITGCDANEVGQLAGTIITCNKGYVEWRNVIIDGHSSGQRIGINFAASTDLRRITNSIITGCQDAIYRGAAIDCLLIGGYRCAIECALVDGCIAIGAQNGFGSCTAAENCIALGGNIGFYGGAGTETADNCLALGSSIGFHNMVSRSCVGMGCGTNAFNIGTAASCLANLCFLGYQGTMTADDCLWSACRTASAGTINTTGGHAALAQGAWTGYTAWTRLVPELARLLEWDLQFNEETGLAGLTEDILGRVRPMFAGGSTTTPGPWEYSNVALDWSEGTNPPGVTITRKGVRDRQIGVAAGDTVTVTVQVEFSVDGDQPQLILFGEGISTQTDTATGDGSGEELEVSATPDRDTVLTIRYYQRDTGAAEYATFTDLEVGIS